MTTNNDLGQNLLRYKKNQKYFIFDFETCNLNLLSEKNKPWQVAYITAEGEKIIESRNAYVKWDILDIKPEVAYKIHYDPVVIEQEGEMPEEVIKGFEKYLYDPEYRIIMFNGLNFDVYIHGIWRKLIGLQPDYSYINRVIDCHALVKAFKADLKFSNEQNFLFWQYSVMGNYIRRLKTNLGQSCYDHGIDFDANAAHNALYDVEKTHKLFLKIIHNMEVV